MKNVFIVIEDHDVDGFDIIDCFLSRKDAHKRADEYCKECCKYNRKLTSKFEHSVEVADTEDEFNFEFEEYSYIQNFSTKSGIDLHNLSVRILIFELK